MVSGPVDELGRLVEEESSYCLEDIGFVDVARSAVAAAQSPMDFCRGV